MMTAVEHRYFFFYDIAQYFLRYINMAEYATSNIRDI